MTAILALACALAACDSAKSTQSTSLPMVSTTASGAKVEAPPATTKVPAMSTMTSKEVTAKSDGVELTATLHTTKERLVVDFAVTNNGHANVYLTDVTLDPKTAGL